MGTYTKQVKFLLSIKTPKCKLHQQKSVESKIIKKTIKELPKSKKILATGGVIPYILMPDKKVYHFRGFSKAQENYDILLVERNGSGDTFPASMEQVNNLYEKCKKYAKETYLNSKWYYFASGNFPQNCLN